MHKFGKFVFYEITYQMILPLIRGHGNFCMQTIFHLATTCTRYLNCVYDFKINVCVVFHFLPAYCTAVIFFPRKGIELVS